ncbi:hypothetical protein NDU88_006026 [Pleurodeles waltl]|uniref:Uncharacterized protein n=1 Tax=Pleurodeles waltl TaxID=8319 RepID=A0AAV7TX39_PLEWA|nr:hypothetical protein NDU88_006026 [Pleurodeles waltl]
MASTPVSPFSSSGPQAHYLQRVGQPLPARSQAGRPDDLLRLKGESRQRPPRSGQALSSCSACYVRGRRASPPQLGRARIAVPRLSLLDPWRGESRQRSTRPEQAPSRLIRLQQTGVTSSAQSGEYCRPASQSTRAPGSLRRPRVRQGFWPLVTSSQAALPYAAPLSLAVTQHFSGAGFTLAGLRYCG